MHRCRREQPHWNKCLYMKTTIYIFFIIVMARSQVTLRWSWGFLLIYRYRKFYVQFIIVGRCFFNSPINTFSRKQHDILKIVCHIVYSLFAVAENVVVLMVVLKRRRRREKSTKIGLNIWAERWLVVNTPQDLTHLMPDMQTWHRSEYVFFLASIFLLSS